MTAWPSPDLVRVVGWTLVHFLWQGALIAALLQIGLRASAKARTRHNLSLAALAAMAAAPVATFFLVRANAPILVIAPAGSGEGDPLWSWQAPLVGLWLAGVVALTARTAAGLWLVERLRREAIALPAEWIERCRALHARLPTVLPVIFRQSHAVTGPILIGWFKPMVLIPAGALLRLPAAQLEAVILHELAHVRRFDAFANLVQTLVETLLFYHPAVWWVSARLRAERENCCDDLAVAVSGDPAAYVRALVSFETYGQAPSPALAAGGSSVRDRAARLLGMAEGPVRPALPKVVALVVVAAATLTAAYSSTVEAAADPDLPVADNPAASVPPAQVRMPAIAASLAAQTRVVSADLPEAPRPLITLPLYQPPITVLPPGVDPAVLADSRIRYHEREAESGRAVLDTSLRLLAAARTAVEEDATPAIHERNLSNLHWLPKSLELEEAMIVLHEEAKLATIGAEAARQDYLAGRAFRADAERAERRRATAERAAREASSARMRHQSAMMDDQRRIMDLAAREGREARDQRLAEERLAAEEVIAAAAADPMDPVAAERAGKAVEAYTRLELRSRDLDVTDSLITDAHVALDASAAATEWARREALAYGAVREAVEQGERTDADLARAGEQLKRAQVAMYEARDQLFAAQKAVYDNSLRRSRDADAAYQALLAQQRDTEERLAAQAQEREWEISRLERVLDAARADGSDALSLWTLEGVLADMRSISIAGERLISATMAPPPPLPVAIQRRAEAFAPQPAAR